MNDSRRIVSGILSQEEFEALEKVRSQLKIPRSELIRRAVVQFLAIHDFKVYIYSKGPEALVEIFKDIRRYIDTLYPHQKSDITKNDGSSESSETFTSPRIEIEGGEVRE